MPATQPLTDAEIRAELKTFGLTNVGPVNASTRGAYLKKLEKLRKASGSVSHSQETVLTASFNPSLPSSQTTSISPERKSRQRSSSASRRSVRSSRASALNGADVADEEELVIPPSPVKKVHTPRPPPTVTVFDQSPPAPVRIPGRENSTKHMQTYRPSRSSATAASKINDQTVKTRENVDNNVPDIPMRLPEIDRPLRITRPPPKEKSAAAHSKPYHQVGTEDADISNSNASSIVEDFRSKLNDESLWLNKFSLDTKLTTRRRPLAESSRISDAYSTIRPKTSLPQTNGQTKNNNPALKPVDSYFFTFSRYLRDTLKKYKDSFKQNYSKAPGGRREELEKFRATRCGTLSGYEYTADHQASGTFVTRVTSNRSVAQRSKIWLKLSQETSRYILLLLLGFLAFIVLAYLGVVYRECAKKVTLCIYGAGVDTVDFVYRKMILPVICVTIIVAFVYGVFWYKRYKWHKVAEEQRKIFEMVEEIIAILKKHHEECLTDGNRQPYLAVPHVRDMLIPAQRRKELYPSWDKAVEYLNENESRIRTENQCISGEEFMVWRWLQAANAGLQRQEDKLWQGHAFPEEEIANHSPRYPFFECLKLRGLFDPDVENGDGWPQHVQDAIIEKLGSRIRVLHLALDLFSKEGCVYMKLGSVDEAGEAFKILNGSWFNGRLVTVKYLRPARYHERFPDAMKACIPLTVTQARNSMGYFYD